jgi:hypothetical protein
MTRRVAPALVLLTIAASLFGALPGPATAGPTPHTLTVTKGGEGKGSVTSDVQPGISCGPTCSFDFPSGTAVVLTATPGANTTFARWTGDCTGTGTCQVTMGADHTVRAVFDRTYRPDAWIKLCGLSTGCTIDPLPHPWHGNDVYNDTGRKQKVAVRMEDGEDVRFWILLQNDGAARDTIVVQGCQGTRRFVVNKVLLGKHKRPEAGTTKVTGRFKKGTLSFDFPPASQRKHSVFTLSMIAPTTAEGVSYTCRITIHSENAPTLTDTLLAKMTTY